jgi:hypothetical protein
VPEAAVLKKLGTGALLLLLALGCGRFQQARECASFVSTVNAWLSATPPKPAAAASAELIAKDARSTAVRYDKLASDLAALSIEAEELRPRVDRYRTIATKAAESLRAVAEALDKKDAETARKKRVEFDDIARGEAPLVDEINRLCK